MIIWLLHQETQKSCLQQAFNGPSGLFYFFIFIFIFIFFFVVQNIYVNLNPAASWSEADSRLSNINDGVLAVIYFDKKLHLVCWVLNMPLITNVARFWESISNKTKIPIKQKFNLACLIKRHNQHLFQTDSSKHFLNGKW